LMGHARQFLGSTVVPQEGLSWYTLVESAQTEAVRSRWLAGLRDLRRRARFLARIEPPSFRPAIPG